MKGLFAKLSAGLKVMFEPAPDPRDSFGYTYKRQYELLKRVREALANTILSHERLESRRREMQAMLDAFDEEDGHVSSAGGEQVSAQHAHRQRVATEHLREIEHQIAETIEEENRLQTIEQKLASQIEALLVRQELVQAQQTAAEAQMNLRKDLSHVSQDLRELDDVLASAEQRAKRFRQQVREVDESLGISGEPHLP